MDFTREPVIETVITSKEGYKLVVRSSGATKEEHYEVAAVEVVSFGSHCFFRFLEKPTAFLLPMAHYEVVEMREVRATLKKPQVEKAIKIGGGKKGSNSEEEEGIEEERISLEEVPVPEVKEVAHKKERRRSYKTARKEEAQSVRTTDSSSSVEEKSSEPPTPRRPLLPPPTQLISQTMDRYKEFRTSRTVEESEVAPSGEDLQRKEENIDPKNVKQ